MRKLSLDEIRKHQLEMLDYFHDFCMKHSLRYSLCGGTLLGAIRHGGYIPWDDDIDLMMPRPDYERLSELMNDFNNGRYALLTPFKNDMPSFPYAYCKVCDMNTMLIEKPQTKHIKYHVYLDIFPIDGLPNRDDRIHSLFKNMHKLEMCYVAICIAHYNKGYKSGAKKLFWIAVDYISRIIKPSKILSKITDIAKAYNFDTSAKVANFTCGQGEKEINSKEDFSFSKEISFEGKLYKCITGKHNYLKGLYGDYMKLPPKEKQVLTHDYEAYGL